MRPTAPCALFDDLQRTGSDKIWVIADNRDGIETGSFEGHLDRGYAAGIHHLGGHATDLEFVRLDINVADLDEHRAYIYEIRREGYLTTRKIQRCGPSGVVVDAMTYIDADPRLNRDEKLRPRRVRTRRSGGDHTDREHRNRYQNDRATRPR